MPLSSPGTRSDTLQGATSSQPRFEFPFKLHAILNDAAPNNQEHIVSWLPPDRDNSDYDAFKVHDKEAFERMILPRYFLSAPKYRSFTRQLAIYDFEMLKGDPSTAMEFGAYSHPLFRRGQPDLCKGMTRNRIKNKWKWTKTTVKRKQEEQQDLWLHLENNTTKNTNQTGSYDNDPIELAHHGAFILPEGATGGRAVSVSGTLFVETSGPRRPPAMISRNHKTNFQNQPTAASLPYHRHHHHHHHDEDAQPYKDDSSSTTLPLLHFARMANTYLFGMEQDPSDLTHRQVLGLETLGANIAQAMLGMEYPSSSSCSISCGGGSDSSQHLELPLPFQEEYCWW